MTGRPGLSRASLVLHWIVAAAVLAMLAYGYWLQTQPGGPGKTALVQIHKSFGLLVLAGALARLAWRWREGFPLPASGHRAWERRGARALHLFVIGASVLMPLSGILRSLAYARPVALFGIPVIPKLFEQKQDTLYAIAATTHDLLAIGLGLAILLHVLAALKHHFFDRDATLLRMLRARPRDPA